jgi:uncharacterized protein (DUF433 family)
MNAPIQPPPGIECRPEIMSGKPVVAGTRITVESLVERLAAGESSKEILQAHPRLTKEGLQAALPTARGLKEGG